MTLCHNHTNTLCLHNACSHDRKTGRARRARHQNGLSTLRSLRCDDVQADKLAVVADRWSHIGPDVCQSIVGEDRSCIKQYIILV